MNDARPHGVPAPRSEGARLFAAALGGAMIGLALGLFAGPIGLASGALIGAALGTLAERAIQRAQVWEEKNDAELDATIGVSGGDMGAPSSGHVRAAERALDEADFFASVGLLESDPKVRGHSRAA